MSRGQHGIGYRIIYPSAWKACSAKFADAKKCVRGILSPKAHIGLRSDHHTKGRRIMDWKLEVVAIPVSDVDRTKAFYTEKVGFNLDHDHRVSDEIRFVQLTPPGSACSIALGIGLMESQPGSVQGVQLVVSDIEAARAELVERGVEVSEVQEFDWGSFVFFSDPDGNGWAVQQVPARD
jgi:predicted enzyme related to lactoylglutathione lyase